MFTEVKNGYTHPDAVPMKTVKLTEALAVAYAAYRINNNTYTKDTRRFSCDENKTQFDNKSLVRYYLEKKLDTADAKYLPADFEMFEPTEADYASVQEALKWMKRYVMLGLADLNDFTADMVRELSQDEVPFKGMGLIAFAPEFIKRDQHETGLKKTIRVEYRNSKHIEPVGGKVETVVEVLDKRYSAQWESYNYTCVTTDGNLVSFMNKFEHAVGDRKRLKAKVKSHTKNRLFSADETRLNYVKLYKV
tara:strand:- start:2928 stop:3674 length:747 start_codon:yes stop_codon:yes gene_type:complete